MKRLRVAFLWIASAAGAWGASGDEVLKLPAGRARVVRDVGRKGNVKGGNLVDPGDEIAWTLPAGVSGAYRVELDVRTGSRGEGANFIEGYRLVAPARCFLPGRAREMCFSRSPNSAPRVVLRGKGWAVFRGRITAQEPLILHAGDELRVHSLSHWAKVYNLVLTRLRPAEQVDVKLRVAALAHLFPQSKGAAIECAALNYSSEPRAVEVALSLRGERGRAAAETTRSFVVKGRSSRAFVWRPAGLKLGPFFVRARLRGRKGESASDAVQIGVVPDLDPRSLPDSSPFGIHKRDLEPWPAIGAKWDRLWDTGDTWNRMQPQPGPIDFETLDRKAAAARRLGVKVLYVFAYTPTWASSHPEWPHYTGRGATAPPKSLAPWERFVFETARRYRGAIDHFEVWNEPNGGFFKGTVEDYVALLRSAYCAVKRANPDATVIGVSGTGGYLPWMERVFHLGGLKFMDAVSVHTYTSPSSPEEANLPGRLAATRALIAKYGGRQPLWNTEVGYWVPDRSGVEPLTPAEIAAKAPADIAPNWKASWPYRPVDEYAAAAMLARHYLLNMAAGVRHVFWYSWVSHAFPMFTASGAARMHTLAFAGAAARLSDATYVGRVDLGAKDVFILLFEKPEGAMAALWRAGREPRRVAIPAAAGLRVWDLWGNGAARGPAAEIELELTERPTYVMGPTLADLRRICLAGERFVFEAVDARIARDVGKKKAKEMTSKAYHGDRRVVGLPDAGDELVWTLAGLPSGRYEIGFEARVDGALRGSYRARVEGAHSTALELEPDPRFPVEVTRRTKTYVMKYGRLRSRRAVELRAGDRIFLKSTAAWAYVCKLILTKRAESRAEKTARCPRLPAGLVLPAPPPQSALRLDIRDRRQVVIGVADRFASTSERDSWRGPKDASAVAYVGWTPQALWVRVDVTDNVRRVARGRGAYNGDCVEVFLDLRRGGSLGSPAPGPGVYQILIAPPAARRATPIEATGRAPAGVKAWGMTTEGGYSIVCVIPWPDGRGRAGREFGFDIAVDDADNVGEPRARRRSQLVWHGTANDFQDPSAYGRVVLTE